MRYEAREFIVKNNLKVTLRTPDVSEAGAILGFIKKVTGQTPFLLSVPEDFSINVADEEKFLENSEKGKNYFLIAYCDGVIVGDCNINFGIHRKDCHRGSIGIAIDKAYWGLGIGSIMLDELIRLACETDGIEQIELGVLDTNERAIRLYEKKGFVKTGIIPNAIKQLDGTDVNEIMMTRFLYEKTPDGDETEYLSVRQADLIAERAKNGYCYNDIMNLGGWLAAILPNMLRDFLKKGYSWTDEEIESAIAEKKEEWIPQVIGQLEKAGKVNDSGLFSEALATLGKLMDDLWF